MTYSRDCSLRVERREADGEAQPTEEERSLHRAEVEEGLERGDGAGRNHLEWCCNGSPPARCCRRVHAARTPWCYPCFVHVDCSDWFEFHAREWPISQLVVF